MATKPKTRTTKKPAAKQKRYVRVAVKAGKATLQESDCPDRGFKTPRQAKPTAEEVGRSIGDVLGRKLDDLLAGRDVTSAAVHAWTAEKHGENVTEYHANTATAVQPLPAKMKPVEEALNRLRAAIIGAEICTEAESERLISALSPPLAPQNVDKLNQPGSGALAGIINELAERIYADNRRRNDLLDRLEL